MKKSLINDYLKALNTIVNDNRITYAITCNFVDNYLINGEFVSKEDDKNWWLDCEYDNLSDCDKDFYEYESKYIEKKWLEYVTNNACLYNDDYACLSF